MIISYSYFTDSSTITLWASLNAAKTSLLILSLSLRTFKSCYFRPLFVVKATTFSIQSFVNFIIQNFREAIITDWTSYISIYCAKGFVILR